MSIFTKASGNHSLEALDVDPAKYSLGKPCVSTLNELTKKLIEEFCLAKCWYVREHTQTDYSWKLTKSGKPKSRNLKSLVGVMNEDSFTAFVDGLGLPSGVVKDIKKKYKVFAKKLDLVQQLTEARAVEQSARDEDTINNLTSQLDLEEGKKYSFAGKTGLVEPVSLSKIQREAEKFIYNAFCAYNEDPASHAGPSSSEDDEDENESLVTFQAAFAKGLTLTHDNAKEIKEYYNSVRKEEDDPEAHEYWKENLDEYSPPPTQSTSITFGWVKKSEQVFYSHLSLVLESVVGHVLSKTIKKAKKNPITRNVRGTGKGEKKESTKFTFEKDWIKAEIEKCGFSGVDSLDPELVSLVDLIMYARRMDSVTLEELLKDAEGVYMKRAKLPGEKKKACVVAARV